MIFSGDKGEPGVDCDVIDKIEMLVRENKVQSQQISSLEQTVDDVVTKLHKSSEGLLFLLNLLDLCSKCFDSFRKKGKRTIEY